MALSVSSTLLEDRGLPDWCSLKICMHPNDLLYKACLDTEDLPVGVAIATHRTYQPYRAPQDAETPTMRRIVEISLLEVREDFRRRRIGKSLLEKIASDFQEENIILACTENNEPAYRLYTSAGFCILWVDVLESAPWFIKTSPLEKLAIREIVDQLYALYDIKEEFDTSLTGEIWREND